MQEIRQTFSEDNYKQAQGQSDFKSYVVSIANKKRVGTGMVVYLILFLLIMIGGFLDEEHRKFFMLLFIPLLLVLPLLSFFRKYLSVNQVIELYGDKVIIDGKEIYFKDIATYQVQFYQGVYIHITVKSGQKIILTASRTFVSTTGMETIARDFDSIMKGFISKNLLEGVRKKSLMESNWWLVLLIPVTGIYIAFLIYGLIKGISFPPMFLIYCAPLIALWSGFLRSKRKNQGKGG